MTLEARSHSAPAQKARGFFVFEEPPQTIHKRCRCCGEVKPAEQLAKDKGKPKTLCLDCERRRCRERYARNREKVCAQAREKYWSDPELRNKRRESAKAYRASPKGLEGNRKAVERYKQNHPERTEARVIAMLAEKRGELKRPAVCEVVGCDRTDLHKHHPNYSKPKDVVFICREHHERVHHRRVDLRLKPGAARKIARAPKAAALAA